MAIKVEKSERYPGLVRASGSVTVRKIRYDVKMREFSTNIFTVDFVTVSDYCTVMRGGKNVSASARAVVCGEVTNAVIEATR